MNDTARVAFGVCLGLFLFFVVIPAGACMACTACSLGTTGVAKAVGESHDEYKPSQDY